MQITFYLLMLSIFSLLLLSSLNAEKLRLAESSRQLLQQIGSKLRLFCAAQEGTGPLYYKWTKNGHLLPPTGANHQVKSSEDNSVLIIHQITVTDAGNYSCSVSNGAGQSDHQTTMLIVKGF